MNLLVTGTGVSAASLDDALGDLDLDARNFTTYGHFGVHRVVTLYALNNSLGVLQKTRNTCLEEVSALLVITNESGALTPESKKLIDDAQAVGVPVFEYRAGYKHYRESVIESSHFSEEESVHFSEEDPFPDSPRASAEDPPEEARGGVWRVETRVPRPIARYDSDEEARLARRRAPADPPVLVTLTPSDKSEESSDEE
jgi:hypothetical protein